MHTAANGPVPCSPYSSILIEQSQPFIVDELVKAAQLRSQAITDKSKAHWTGEAGHLPVTLWPGPERLANRRNVATTLQKRYAAISAYLKCLNQRTSTTR